MARKSRKRTYEMTWLANWVADEAHHHLGYEKENHLNIRWLCLYHHGREHSELIEFNGESLSTKEWAQRLGLSQAALRARLSSANWTKEEALTTPKDGAKGKRQSRMGPKRVPKRKQREETEVYCSLFGTEST